MGIELIVALSVIGVTLLLRFYAIHREEKKEHNEPHNEVLTEDQGNTGAIVATNVDVTNPDGSKVHFAEVHIGHKKFVTANTHNSRDIGDGNAGIMGDTTSEEDSGEIIVLSAAAADLVVELYTTAKNNITSKDEKESGNPQNEQDSKSDNPGILAKAWSWTKNFLGFGENAEKEKDNHNAEQFNNAATKSTKAGDRDTDSLDGYAAPDENTNVNRVSLGEAHNNASQNEGIAGA